MRAFVFAQRVASLALLVLAPVATEQSYVVAAALLAVGGLGMVAASGLARGKAWGVSLSIAAYLAFAVPAAVLLVVVLVDLQRGRTSVDSSGLYGLLPMVIVPWFAAAYLFRRRTATLAT